MATTPNILLFITDQQSASAMSCSHNVELSTPAMDALAADGVRFERAYCPYPLCVPARNSMFTGKMPHEIEFRDGEIAEPDATLGRLIAAAGYDCRYAGKRHITMSQAPEVCGFTQLSGPGDAEVTERCCRFLRERGSHGSGRSTASGGAGGGAAPTGGGTETDGAPFFLVASFINPHNICEWARDQDLPLGDIEERPIHDCPVLPANHQIAPFEPQAIRSYMSAFPGIFSTPEHTEDPNWWRRYRNAYFRMVEMVDAQIGAVIDALKESGAYDETLVVFLSDHGDGQGAHRWKQKLVLYEEANNVPLIVKPPKPAQVPGRPAERALVCTGLDLLPTICDYAGAETPNGLAGRSLREILERPSTPATGTTGTPAPPETPATSGMPATSGTPAPPERWRQTLVVEVDVNEFPNRLMGGHLSGRAVYDERYKYVVYDWGRYREQLFDLEADPGEMVNLATSSRFTPLLARMRASLREWCRKTDDAFLRRVPAGDGPAPY